MFGYDQGVLSALLTLDSFIAIMPETENAFRDPRAAELQSFMVAVCESTAPCYTRTLLRPRLTLQTKSDVWSVPCST